MREKYAHARLVLPRPSSIVAKSVSISFLAMAAPESPSVLSSLRLWTFSAAVTPVALGAVLSYKSGGPLSILLLLVTAAVVLAVNGAGNMVNTYFEIMREASRRRPGPQQNHSVRRWDDRSEDAHKHQARVVNSAAYLYGFGMACLWIAMWLSPANSFYLASLFFGGLSSSFIYTGGIRLKFYILGDLLAMFTFGPLSVLFSYTAQSGQFVIPGPLLLALPLALSTEAIIHSKHIRERDRDREAGVLSLAVLLGKQGSYLLFALLLFLPYLVFAIWGTRYSLTLALPLISMPFAFQLERRFREEGPFRELSVGVAKLNFALSSLFVVGCLLANEIPFL